MSRSPALSHTIGPLLSLLPFYCWVLRSGPNWLIYSTINWSRAVWLIKTCNRLQGERKGRGLGHRCYTNDFIRRLAARPDLRSLGWRFQSLLPLLLTQCVSCNAVGPFKAFTQEETLPMDCFLVFLFLYCILVGKRINLIFNIRSSENVIKLLHIICLYWYLWPSEPTKMDSGVMIMVFQPCWMLKYTGV